MHPPKIHTEIFTSLIQKEDWSSLARLMKNIDLNDISDKKIRLRLFFTREVLDMHLQRLNGHGTINAALLVATLKMISNLEKEAGVSNHQFLIFAKALAAKFKTQRLLVDKTLEKKLEFKKMKGLIDS